MPCDAVASKLDGTRAAGRTTHRKRVVLSNALSYAVELGFLLDATPSAASSGGRRSPLRGGQPGRGQSGARHANSLTPSKSRPAAVPGWWRSSPACTTPRSAPRRPSTSAATTSPSPPPATGGSPWKRRRPRPGRRGRTPATAARTANSNTGPSGETRRVPCPPELVLLLRQHLDQFGTDDDGRLFRGERGDHWPTVTYRACGPEPATTAFGQDRANALTRSPRRPYDLRHAAVSTWLNGGVPRRRVADWAGHSVDVLLKIYAKCLDGQEAPRRSVVSTRPWHRQNGTRTADRSRENEADQD